jgi:hypothetical protein
VELLHACAVKVRRDTDKERRRVFHCTGKVWDRATDIADMDGELL